MYNVDIDGSSLLHLAVNSGVLGVSMFKFYDTEPDTFNVDSKAFSRSYIGVRALSDLGGGCR